MIILGIRFVFLPIKGVIGGDEKEYWLQIERLKNASMNPSRGKHISPYLEAIWDALDDSVKVRAVLVCDDNADLGRLRVDGGNNFFNIYCDAHGIVVYSDNLKALGEFGASNGLKSFDDGFILEVDVCKDRIIEGKRLVEKLLSL